MDAKSGGSSGLSVVGELVSQPHGGALRHFPPGVSGNPGGKSAERERLREAMTEFGDEMILIIVDLARHSVEDSVRVKAATYLMDQIVGKALVAVSGPNGGPLKLDAKELYDRLAGVMARAAK